MNQDIWTNVDDYTTGLLAPADPVLDAALAAGDAAGLPPINVSAAQGKMLHVLALAVGARRILELGTLAGYSTIWLARALPADGRLITLEVSPKHAEVAQANVARAGLAQVVDVRVGPALDTLPKLVEEGAGPFDLVFIDADKANIPDYFEWTLKLARVGTLIVVDNVVRDGKILDAGSTDASVQGIRKLNELMAADPRVVATVVQNVGAKGYDGFALAVVVEL